MEGIRWCWEVDVVGPCWKYSGRFICRGWARGRWEQRQRYLFYGHIWGQWLLQVGGTTSWPCRQSLDLPLPSWQNQSLWVWCLESMDQSWCFRAWCLCAWCGGNASRRGQSIAVSLYAWSEAILSCDCRDFGNICKIGSGSCCSTQIPNTLKICSRCSPVVLQCSDDSLPSRSSATETTRNLRAHLWRKWFWLRGSFVIIRLLLCILGCTTLLLSFKWA